VTLHTALIKHDIEVPVVPAAMVMTLRDIQQTVIQLT
jgi:hypothetical protein